VASRSLTPPTPQTPRADLTTKGRRLRWSPSRFPRRPSSIASAGPLRIPDPALIVLVGAAGAGKSTLAARLFAPSEILSSDAFREAVSGDAADQCATRLAFSILHRELERRLAARRLTVVDATNVEAPARRALLVRAALARVPAIAIVLALPATVVVARNAGRIGRVVDQGVVDRHLRRLGAALATDRLGAEGFAAVHVLTTPAEVDLLRIERVPAR
jgi:protein phosphatase